MEVSVGPGDVAPRSGRIGEHHSRRLSVAILGPISDQWETHSVATQNAAPVMDAASIFRCLLAASAIPVSDQDSKAGRSDHAVSIKVSQWLVRDAPEREHEGQVRGADAFVDV